MRAAEQVFVGIPGPELDAESTALLAAHQPGGVVLFKRNIQDEEQLNELMTALRRLLLSHPREYAAPLSIAVVWVAGSHEDVARFWMAVLIAGYGCYITLPWLVSRPPRLLEGAPPSRFWTIGDDIVQEVMDTNFVAHDRLTRLAVPHMIEKGWGRIVTVTTRLSTMNRAGGSPYGSSKAALEMSSEIWSKELKGTGVTVNILNPGAAI